jgi:putative ABC transport system permease protein
MRIPELLGRLIPSTSLYLGLRNLSRESGPYVAPLFVVATCLCLGVFEASVARSANTWLDDRWHYQAGGDYSFTLGTRMENGMEMGKDAWMMPIEQFRQVPGVTDAMRVGNYEVLPRTPRGVRMRLMAIDRLDFARVAYLRDDYTREPMGELLNKLGATPSGLLVTPKFLRDNTLNVGERLKLEVFVETEIQPLEFMIVGTFDYLPTVYENKKMTMVANLDYIHDQFGGISPFSLWLRLAPGTDRVALRQTFEKMQVVMMNDVDGVTLLEEDRQALERVGIFGNLTVGFLAGSLLAWLGLLIYTFSSLIGRVRRFTILRALGLRLGQVLATVTVEYLGVILYGIAFGTAAGIATAKLFVPYFQFTEDPSAQVPPFTPQIAWEQIGLIVVVYFLVLALAEFIVLLRLTRREAFQALRMGDEE